MELSGDGVASFFLLNETCTRLALVHNLQFKSKPSGWGLPGGRLNEQEQQDENRLESFKKAAFRELREETGIRETDVEDFEFCHVSAINIFNDSEPMVIPVVVFAGRALKDIVRETKVPKETDRCSWFPFCPDDTPTVQFPNGTYPSHIIRVQETVAALRRDYAWEHVQIVRQTM